MTGIRGVVIGAWCLIALLVTPVAADRGVDRVVALTAGAGGGESYPPGRGPDAMLGEPDGVLWCLGWCGSVTLEMVDNRVVDGPGPDFLVFENAVVLGGVLYTEAAVVEVSQDGEEWYSFPRDYDPECGTGSDCYWNLAGVHEVGDLSDDYGDPFDLADVGLAWVRFFRLTDCGLEESDTHPEAVCPQYDDDGEFIDDEGNRMFLCGPSNCGHDLDAIVALHSESASPTPGPGPTPEPTPEPTPAPFRLVLRVAPGESGPGTAFRVDVEVVNDVRPRSLRLYVVLDVSGEYFFWPSWSRTPDHHDFSLGPAESREWEVLSFVWPRLAASLEGWFWAGCIDLDGYLVGDLAREPFRYEP
jgi:hypothetical protein